MFVNIILKNQNLTNIFMFILAFFIVLREFLLFDKGFEFLYNSVIYLLSNYMVLYLTLSFFALVYIFLINSFEIVIIRRLSLFFCMNLIKFTFLNLFKVPLLYSSFFLLYSLNWFSFIFNIEYSIGLDKLGFIFVFLTIFLIPISLMVSWKSLSYNTKHFFLLFLILEILLINVFCAIDLVLFYIAFETILIPMYFLIGYWGSRERRMHAAYLFFLYTLAGSLFMLIIIIFCQLNFGSTNLNFLLNTWFSPYREVLMWAGFFIAFAVKIPMIPVHLWLPEAHVESATGGSVALAGILLKLGTYGIIRFLIPLFQFSSFFLTPFVYLISIIGIFYASLTTLRQIDLKKIIAYSSVIHMNYLIFGLFAYNLEGFIGSLILMVAHGFVSGGLFVCVGILYERYHTRLKKPYGGLNLFMPIFSFFFLILTLANISFPGSINFIGEFLVLLSIFMKNIPLAILIIFLMILSTCYSLWLYNKVFSGLLPKFIKVHYVNLGGLLVNKLVFKRLLLSNYTDINLRELVSLTYLVIPTLFLGINPIYFISYIEFDLSTLLVLVLLG